MGTVRGEVGAETDGERDSASDRGASGVASRGGGVFAARDGGVGDRACAPAKGGTLFGHSTGMSSAPSVSSGAKEMVLETPLPPPPIGDGDGGPERGSGGRRAEADTASPPIGASCKMPNDPLDTGRAGEGVIRWTPAGVCAASGPVWTGGGRRRGCGMCGDSSGGSTDMWCRGAGGADGVASSTPVASAPRGDAAREAGREPGLGVEGRERRVADVDWAAEDALACMRRASAVTAALEMVEPPPPTLSDDAERACGPRRGDPGRL